MNPEKDTSVEAKKDSSWLAKTMCLEWLGQTIASICWICSVFVYGIEGTGDWLQLIAGVSWFVANMASLKNA